MVQQVVSCFKDLFIAPTFDELEQVARDAKGNPRKLSARQLRSIREHGSVAAVLVIICFVTIPEMHHNNMLVPVYGIFCTVWYIKLFDR